MTDIMMVVSVAGLFLVRVGIPIIALVALGIVVDRWQRRREVSMERSPQTSKSH